MLFRNKPIDEKNDGHCIGIENEAKASKFMKIVCQIAAQGRHCSNYFKTEKKTNAFKISFFSDFICNFCFSI